MAAVADQKTRAGRYAELFLRALPLSSSVEEALAATEVALATEEEVPEGVPTAGTGSSIVTQPEHIATIVPDRHPEGGAGKARAGKGGKKGKGRSGRGRRGKGKHRRAYRPFRVLYSWGPRPGVMLSWERFQGPHGGYGWRNPETGEVRYQVERPMDRGRRQQEPAPRAKFRPVQYAGVVINLVRRMAGSHNIVKILDLRRALAEEGLDRTAQDAAIHEARRSGAVTASSFEGRHGITPEEHEAGIVEPGSPHRLGYLHLKVQASLTVDDTVPATPAVPAGQARDPLGRFVTERRAGQVADGSVLPEKLEVWREWDPLRAVLVGLADNDVLPAWYPSWTDDPCGNEVAGPRTAGMTKAEYDPEAFAACIRQLEGLCEILEGRGVQVFRAPPTPLEVAKADPVGLGATWAREEFTVVGRCWAWNQTRAPHRNKERAALEPFAASLAQRGTCLLTPPPCSAEMDPDWEHDPRLFLEGGDVYHVGRDVLVGMSYLATSPAGFRWLAEALEPWGFRLWPAYLAPDWEHTDYVLGLIREGLAVAYLPGFKDGRLPSPILDWDVVELTRDETDTLRGSNGLALGDNAYLVPAGSRRLERALERKGVEVIPVEFDAVTYWQGGLHCATVPLWREGPRPHGVRDVGEPEQ
jgi:glycine amidinotransferase